MTAKYQKWLTEEEALAKMQRYCAYSERSHSDVRSKLIGLKVYGDKLERVISQLIADDFLNEQRFAEAYVRGKWKYNHWGRIKIRQGLSAKGVSDYCKRKGMEQITEEEYEAKLMELLEKRQTLKPGEDKAKTARYLLQKGYEAPLVWSMIKEST